MVDVYSYRPDSEWRTVASDDRASPVEEIEGG